jgi:hypothetical protein
LPDDVDLEFIDENLEPINFDDPVGFVGISMMLTIQVKRGWEIADTQNTLPRKNYMSFFNMPGTLFIKRNLRC